MKRTDNVNENADKSGRDLVRKISHDQRGMATVEYAIVLVAAAGLAGVLVAILKSDWVKEMLQNIISNALGGVA
ncbi:MAG: DUF4244 domain-containing protein [Candidatus Ancillula sp.]|nr:DUF4244 domain-containing protein [Candidatus Ancillula sp.]